MISLSPSILGGVAAVTVAASVLAGVQTWRADRLDDQVTTLRLAEKDLLARIVGLRRDVDDRDEAIRSRASAEAADRGQSDRSCAADISSSFQKGVAAGRALNHAKPAVPGAGADAGGLLDYRQAWAVDAYRPGS